MTASERTTLAKWVLLILAVECGWIAFFCKLYGYY
jgi:hypothetical protein